MLDLIRLEQTCGACPEQYEAFYNDEQVGYLRLRHGLFSVRFPDAQGKTLYTTHPKGDGVFDVDERDKYLNIAKFSILQELITRGELYDGS